MSKAQPRSYSVVPRGCRFSVDTKQHMVPVDLDDLVVHGTRAQRRWAQRELQRKKNKSI